MSPLKSRQQTFSKILAQGPDVLRDALFTGPLPRVILGFQVHANTISHARLVALEETFPHCRAYLGDETFNRLSHIFIEDGLSEKLSQIGPRFPDWLAARGGDPIAVHIARFELLWLQSFHAAEAPAMKLSDLAGQCTNTTLGMYIARHPAARILPMTHQIAWHLGLDSQRFDAVAAMLITRPDAHVHMHPLDQMAAHFFEILEVSLRLETALEHLVAAYPDADAFSAVLRLIETGALTHTQKR